MKVRATGPGFFGYERRREGDVFEIKEEKEFSSNWMEKVGEEVQLNAGQADRDRKVKAIQEEVKRDQPKKAAKEVNRNVI